MEDEYSDAVAVVTFETEDGSFRSCIAEPADKRGDNPEGWMRLYDAEMPRDGLTGHTRELTWIGWVELAHKIIEADIERRIEAALAAKEKDND